MGKWRTPGYMVREEVQREKLRAMAAKRAWSIERRLEMGNGSEIARDCWKEIKERTLRIEKLSEREEERRNFYRKRGIIEGEKKEIEKRGNYSGRSW